MPRFVTFAALAGLALASGCRQDMQDQPKYKPYAASAFFADGMSARQPVPDTVARGHLDANQAFYTGRINGKLVQRIPIKVDRALIERGRQRFGIYCTPCHDHVGTGKGVVVRRGFKHPPSYHTERLRDAPAGHFFDVITNGFGAMYSYKTRVAPRDRWAIVAYIRTLQLSQYASLDDVPPAERQKLMQEPAQ